MVNRVLAMGPSRPPASVRSPFRPLVPWWIWRPCFVTRHSKLHYRLWSGQSGLPLLPRKLLVWRARLKCRRSRPSHQLLPKIACAFCCSEGTPRSCFSLGATSLTCPPSLCYWRGAAWRRHVICVVHTCNRAIHPLMNASLCTSCSQLPSSEDAGLKLERLLQTF